MGEGFTFLGMTVPKIAMINGGVLVLWGIASYFLQDADPRSITALIPAIIGFPMVVLGVLSILNEENRHHYMHASMVFALVMILGGARVFFSDMSTLAATSHLLLIVTGSSFTFVGIKSFRHARIQREGLVGSQ
ncbi:MAG: hypothetical protein CMA12_02160 [Euryarchaeota archaeon]|nr:hypothetical protein [Euryarchaeota archaeon]OUW22845.1 MAG: hypothetical protein CBD33_00735 [Euryarchaeota archaeon TMED173]|tara:strand:- start:1381 stop:1782 length:402 start_codon:yes stop_codon:yes gene_type:complete